MHGKRTARKIWTKAIGNNFLAMLSITNKLLEAFHLHIILVSSCGCVCCGEYKDEKLTIMLRIN